MTQPYNKLIEKIAIVTRRWRAQRLLKGLAITLAVAVASLYISVYIGSHFRFSSASVWTLRAWIIGATIGAAIRFLIIPAAQRVSPAQVARFIEEKHPQLQERLSSAVEMGGAPIDPQKISPALMERLIEDALEKTNRIDVRSLIQSRNLAAFGGLCLAIIMAVILSLLLGPYGLRFGAAKLFPMGTEAASIPPTYKIIVTPGDVEVAKGIDLKITARFEGTMPDKVDLFMKEQNAPDWTTQAMITESESNGFTWTLFNVTTGKEYYIGTEQIQSRHFRITVGDLPRIEKIVTTYHYPAYTGLPDRSVENDGNLSAIKGTTVDFQAQVNQSVTGAKILYNDNATQAMTVEGQTLKARIPIQKNASYVIQVIDRRGRTYLASEEFKIEALPDQPPTVSIVKPGRDRKATRLEEVLTEVKAEDDFGLARVELVYAVNGGKEMPVTLFDARKNRGKKSISATHTFFLEEMNLSPGDIVTYYAQARDSESDKSRVTRSDIYFLDITRSDKEFTQAQAAGGGQGGGNAFRHLTQKQREVIAATWKLVRDKDRFDKKSYSESLRAVVLTEGRLKKEAKTLSDEIQQRMQVFGEETLKKLSEFFTKASEKMGESEELLVKGSTQEALPPERAALQELLKAESLFRELQVSFGNSAGNNSQNERLLNDLEELFALEMDKLKNQYETLAQQSGGAREDKMDEITRKLKELAERQQRLNENAMRPQGGQPSQGGGSGQSMQAQAQLMKELEELKRQLERLARDKPDRQNNELRGQLDKTLSEMKKSLEKMRQNDSAGAVSSGARAQQQLDNLQRQLQNTQQGRLSDQLREARKNVEQMLEQQKQIEKEVNRLTRTDPQGGSKGSDAARSRIMNNKEDLADRVEQTKEQIDRMAQGQQGQRGGRQKSATGEKLAQARDTLSQEDVAGKIREGKDLLSKGQIDQAKGREGAITSALNKTLRQLKEAEQTVGQSEEEKLTEALTRTRDLVDNLSSLSERMRNNPGSPRNQDRQGKGKANQPSQDPNGQPSPNGQKDPSQQGSDQNNSGQNQNNASNQDGSAQGQGRNGQASQNRGQAQPGKGQGGNPSPNRTQQPLSGEVSGQPNGDSAPPAGGVPGSPSPDADPQGRQFDRELQERVREATELAGRIPNREMRTTMEQIVGAMRRLDAQRAGNDPQFIERLRAQVLDPLQRLQLELSKKLGLTIAKNKFTTMDEDSVPEEYRRLVEQYYKELAERRK